jgi:hypothetical protein
MIMGKQMKMYNKPVIRKTSLFFVLLILSIVNFSCAPGQYLKTMRTSDSALSGMFTVIHYGYNYSNDPLSLAILDLEGDQYTFEMYANEYEYVSNKGVPAEKALQNSLFFISQHSYYFSSQLSRILDDNGQIVGYELRPLYHVQLFGINDILDVDYRIIENRIIVSADLKRSIEKSFLYRDNYY